MAYKICACMQRCVLTVSYRGQRLVEPQLRKPGGPTAGEVSSEVPNGVQSLYFSALRLSRVEQTIATTQTQSKNENDTSHAEGVGALKIFMSINTCNH